MILVAIAAAGMAAAFMMLNRKLYNNEPDPPGVQSCAVFRGGEAYDTNEDLLYRVGRGSFQAILDELATRGFTVLGAPFQGVNTDGWQVRATYGDHQIQLAHGGYDDGTWFLAVNSERFGPPPAEVMPPIVEALAALDRLTDITWMSRQQYTGSFTGPPAARVVRRD